MKIYAPCPTHHFGRPSISDVSLHLYNTFYRGHRLQVNCNNERKVSFPSSITHPKQGEQKAIRYPQPNYAQTESGTYTYLKSGDCFAGTYRFRLKTYKFQQQMKQPDKETLVRMGYWARAQGRIPGSSFPEQHTDQPHVSLL